MKSIDVKTAKEWLDKNEALLIDVRQPEEYHAVHISEAQLIPLGELEEHRIPDMTNKKIIVHCKLGPRGRTAGEKLQTKNPGLDVYNMEGGIVAWESAGFKVLKQGKAPFSIDRQVQVTIGGGIILGLILGYFVAPAFLLLSAFFGAGLLFAGITGTCRLAIVMAKMPWNK
ncbi:MAG: rhodanese-like domain-containing protein [Coxiellaceae bacterium]|nr:rhodanese-like domain-containing protein [Coxiellaceae bacterium]